jgi:GMP synthase (glutamine-hydrolysing)
MAAQPLLTNVAVIRHLAFEGLGVFAPILKNRGLSLTRYDAGVDNLDEAIDCADLLIVLGGPIGVYEQQRYPFLVQELAALQRRINQDRPTLGICLGAQLIAAAAGAQVYAGDIKEIGWGKLKLTPAGEKSSLSALHDIPVLHWHGDTFDLPDGAQLLAGNENYPHQAFSLGKNILGMQFHPEIDILKIEQWLIGHCCELNSAGIDPVELRQTTHELRGLVEPAARNLLKDWLDQLTLNQPFETMTDSEQSILEQMSHYERKLFYEIDSSDLFTELTNQGNIVVIDTRSTEAYDKEHISSAINIPHRTMTAKNTEKLNKLTTYVTYCDGIGCNASTKGALKMLKLGFRVKELIGGLDWWIRDGYATEGEHGRHGTAPNCGC